MTKRGMYVEKLKGFFGVRPEEGGGGRNFTIEVKKRKKS